MKTNLKLALTGLVGIAIGLGAAQALQAQQVKAAPGYILAEIERDPAKTPAPGALEKYREEAPKTMLASGGQYVIVGGKSVALEGEAPRGGIVMIRFDSVEKARAWYNSPAYAALRPLRQSGMKSRILLVEGVAPK